MINSSVKKKVLTETNELVQSSLKLESSNFAELFQTFDVSSELAFRTELEVVTAVV